MTIQETRQHEWSSEVDGGDDRRLVMAYLDGDIDAFAVIVQNHYDSLHAQARRLLGPVGQPEDALQETFERALKGIRRFGLMGEYRLGPWLSRILSNVCADQRSRAARDLRILAAAAAQPSQEADVADRVSDPQTVESLVAALRELPPNHYRALMLHEVDGLPYADVAEAENISIENARARVSRGKSSLRRSLGGFRSTVGGFLTLPVIRVFVRPSQISSKLAHRIRTAAGQAEQVAGSGASANVDRLAGQIVGSPLGQSALALVSSAPRGALVFGLAATVATVSASTVLLTQPSSRSSQGAVVAPTSAVQAPASPTPATAPPSVPASPSTTPSSTASVQTASGLGSWVNLGTTAGDPGMGAGVAALGAAGCVPQDNVAPPGAGFTYGSALGMSSALSVGDTAATVLSTTGPSFNFGGPVSVGLFGDGGTLPADLVYSASACLSSSGWLTVSLTDPAGDPVAQLTGVLDEVLPGSGDTGYIFRGTVDVIDGAVSAVAGTQFVAQLSLLEPANTAQLTMVFLSADASPAPGQLAAGGAGQPDAASPLPSASSSGSAVSSSADDSTQVNTANWPAAGTVTNGLGQLPGAATLDTPSGEPLSSFYASGSAFTPGN